jgi:hypothetical protein
MQTTDNSNTIFQLAAKLVNHTSQHIFLTGKAGTGKTTFLKYIQANTQKSAVVVAPTGVAAINAGGVTMHSFFQLPFGPFIPASSKGFNPEASTVTDKHGLFSNIRFNADKRDLLNELELLIIDEVSMVRADMLDAMDTILRHFRKKPFLPFGGVQVLYIGDLYQLPPVMPDAEWEILKEYYESPFFFDAKVVAEAAPLYVELKKIYRQNETLFIDLLNNVRNNQVKPTDLQLLNDKYNPGYHPSGPEKYITLSTHNRKADIINAAELNKLPGKQHRFVGNITKEFSEKALPTDMELLLKEGTQVLFIKNDTSGERRYYNGKLAVVKSIAGDAITVSFDTGEPDMKLTKEKWKNIRYTYNKEKDNIEEEEIGSFEQYPIRLAWAITIHKSQGLTFTKAIIDAGASFAAGQVYVALSRCTTLDGIILHSKIPASAIATDERVIRFAEKEIEENRLYEILENEQRTYWADTLLKAFDWTKLVNTYRELAELVPTKKIPDMAAAITMSKSLRQKTLDQWKVANTFREKLEELFQSGTHQIQPHLEERVPKAVDWFTKAIAEDLLKPLQQHIKTLQYASKVRQYVTELKKIESFTWQQLLRLQQTSYGDAFLGITDNPFKDLAPSLESTKGPKPKKAAVEKGSSQRLSLQLFTEGKSIKEIAESRNLSANTIEGHLADFVKTGELDVLKLLSADKLATILKVLPGIEPPLYATPIKDQLGEGYSYGEIRAAINYYQYRQQKSALTSSE